MIRTTQSRSRQKWAAHLQIGEFFRSKTRSGVVLIAVAYAIGLAIWSSPVHAGVHSSASTGIMPLHWRWLSTSVYRARDDGRKQKTDAAKQKDKPRYTGCWGRRRMQGRWKRAYIC